MMWESIEITDKIVYLKKLIENSKESTIDEGDIQIVNALITGSLNTFDGEMGFDIQPHHMRFMKKLWDKAIKTQNDNSIISAIKKRTMKYYGI